MLLAALTVGTLARHGHHTRHEGHARRQAGDRVTTITTITTTSTVTVCPCDSLTSTSVPSAPSATPSTSSVELTSLSTPSPSPTELQTSSTCLSTSSTEVSPSSTALSTSSSASDDWTSVPSSGVYSASDFGGWTNSSGSGSTYTGNVGNPYGSNIIEVSASDAREYKYVVRFEGSNTADWFVVIWNKIGPDSKMDGWYGNACHNFTLSAGATKLYAFDSDSQGGWAAASGSSIPIDDYGGYAATWGEFDFGSFINSGWSGFDVSAIQAQNAGLTVQGMKICSVLNSDTCSAITSGTGLIHNAYTSLKADIGGIGGNLPAGPVRLAVTLDYSD